MQPSDDQVAVDHFDHANYADMGRLSRLVLTVPERNKLRFAANILGRDLMRGPWWLRGLHWFVKTVRGWGATETWYMLLSRMGEHDIAGDVINGFSHHIYHGKDLSDSRSVGGLNQDEVNTALFLLRALEAKEGKL